MGVDGVWGGLGGRKTQSNAVKKGGAFFPPKIEENRKSSF